MLCRRLVLISLLIAVLGVQWLAAVHRGLHGARNLSSQSFGPVLGQSMAQSVAQSWGKSSFEDHTAGSAECLRLDGLLGVQALCGGSVEAGLLQAQFFLPSVVQPSMQPVSLPRLPPARAPPLLLI